jgi:hypothetical protein
MGDDPRQLDPAGPGHGDLHPPRCPRHAQERRRGSVRCNGAVTSRQGPRHDLLLKRALAAGEAVCPPKQPHPLTRREAVVDGPGRHARAAGLSPGDGPMLGSGEVEC